MIKFIVGLFLLVSSSNALEIKCDFEEVYSDGTVQNGFFLIKNKMLRYQYNKNDLFTLFHKDDQFFLVRNNNLKQIQKLTDNLDEKMDDILGISNHRPLKLFIGGKSMGVNIDGGAKVAGSPKADLAFGTSGKPTFFVSYKHGEYKSESGKELKASFQQYGSVKTFFTKEFQSAIEDAGVEKAIKSFLDTATKKATYTYAGITGIKRNDKEEVVLMKGDSEIISDSQNKKIWASNFLPVQKAIKKAGSINLYVVDERGFSHRRSLMDGTTVSEKIALLSVFGKDYGSGTAGKNNVDVLMQDAAPFTIQLMTNDEGGAEGINIDPSSKGHLMFNPELHSGKKEFPKFAKNYEPYFVVRYTGEMNIGWNGGKDFFVGARFLINPSSQTKSGTDI